MKNSKKQVYIIHGYKASPDNHWFPWLKEKLVRNNVTSEILSMPTPSQPKVNEWVNALVTNIPYCDENTFFVAHSLGTITLLKYLEKINKIQKVGGIILVSGFANELPIFNQIDEFKQLEEFTKDEIDFDHIKKVTQYRSIIASGNDPIVPAKSSRNLAEQLGTEYHLINEAGHFLESDGFLELPIVYEELNNMMSKGVAK